MSFDQLLLSRPLYSPNQKHLAFTVHSHNPTPYSITTQVSPIESPRIGDISTIPKTSERGQLYEKLKANLKNYDPTKSIQNGIKGQKVKEAYNLLSDFNDKKQIIQSLKQLSSAEERILLIDKILERKEEMQIAALRLKAKRLEPIFNVIRRKLKLKQRLNQSADKMKKQSIFGLKTADQPNEVLNPMHSYGNIDEQQQQDENTRKELVIEKIQTKYAASVAFSWLTNRAEKQESLQNLSPETVKRNNRRNTTLKQSQKGITGLKQMITKKVSENSDEMIRLGQLKMLENQQKFYNSKDIIAKSKAKVDTGRVKSVQVNRSLRKKKTLDFFTNERKENSELTQQLANEKSNLVFKRRLIVKD
ncbi:unnamed protein product (macronuclear) [Paramecium tetraurelia]|uniref:J domain-containing protein n=1 Tax=Paramecium tetraurelia TaxID=5888 RepID=A0E0N0_PARTE|nr:uncharacterized protein GSPATT00022015001 [Paramecium tetraurelia]CAK88847.1 unnamed protein product [Paramecium tetraurelia]|eukprot:XP_001456244.1 hypothetical protein (macronuclear) [Paramecium tetraurelia strain d4-2]